MNRQRNHMYYKGYVAGYRDGLCNAQRDHAKSASGNDWFHMPVQAMDISSRARNCLSLAGCVYVSDVAELSEYSIATMRGLGEKTASEIAHWLDEKGICYSAWCVYL